MITFLPHRKRRCPPLRHTSCGYAEVNYGQSALPILEELLRLLDAGDLAATDTFAALKAALGGGAAARMTELESRIVELDFPGARETAMRLGADALSSADDPVDSFDHQ